MPYSNERAQHGIPVDRFAREIVDILTVFAVRSQRLMGNPLDGAQPHPIPMLSNII